MTLAELQRVLSAVEPAAVLVPPRVMENLIRQEMQLSAMVWTVPHLDTWLCERTLLFRHVDQADLALAPDQILPAKVILLRWPTEDTLQRSSKAEIYLQTWRQLFHACVHQSLESAWETGQLTPALLRKWIELIGPAAFEEIQNILKEENYLPADANERAVFNEFIAVFLDLHSFSPALLSGFFPGLKDSGKVLQELEPILPTNAILSRTRLPGAPDPLAGREKRHSEADEFFHELEISSNRAMNRGDVVLAAIELQRAARVAPGDQAPKTRLRAETYLLELLERLRIALELSESEAEGWKRLLPVLLEKSDQGSRPAEAALLYELQKICLDHEREIYKLEVIEWFLHAGRRPLQRPLPSQRLVRITRTLRGAMPILTLARLSDQDRAELEKLLQAALHRGEERVRTRFRPLLINAFQDVGLAPKNALEITAFHKMIEELLDRIITYGFVSFSDLRDTISRNQLKLPDLCDAQDFIRGDALIRLDRRLSTVLDGVYRPGEIYLRLLERFTSWQFGTPFGRILTRFVTLPIGGGFLLLEALMLVYHLHGKAHGEEGLQVTPDSTASPLLPPMQVPVLLYYSLWVLFSLIIFGLIHSAPMRDRMAKAFFSTIRGVHGVLIDWPMNLVRHYGLSKILTSWGFQVFYSFFLKPFLLTFLLAIFLPDIRNGLLELSLAFLAANFLINTRPGEAFWESLMKAIQGLFEQLRSGLIPALFRFVVRFFKQILHGIESVLFTVDEWLRFRGGESRQEMVLRAVVTILWMPISYLARFNLLVFIEPCLHPLKLPVCTIAAKFIYPLVPVFKPVLTEFTQPLLGNLLAEVVVWWIVFWLPDVFGFIFWEMKENWTLFRSNQSPTIGPVAVGPHGETVRRLFKPGFHSGTLPRLFARIRQVERKAFYSGNFSSVRLYRASMVEIEESLVHFLTREFCVFLQQSSAWKSHPLSVGKIELSRNQIHCQLVHPQFPEPLTLSFEFRAGWVVAGITDPNWLVQLDPLARTDLGNALVLLYKLADVDLIREQIQASLPNAENTYELTSDHLVIRSGDAVQQISLRPLDPTAADPGTERILFSKRKLFRGDWHSGGILKTETGDPSVLPPRPPANQDSAA